ncbi:M48 family metallopeptidase [Pelagibacterium montanilacus]|uniref:M48 family metallopeptidase n=1 Tax=Pelagibacterium montanilacus TaxID=2185280 RepID=UPI000F8D6E9E|nr:SprT family zinc-dependent metalloprotease [Pelagibacterium montanilacus]
MSLRALFRSPVPDTTSLALPGREVTVRVRVNARARRYRLSFAPDGCPVLTFPKGGRWAEATAFLRRNAGWLDARIDRHQERPRLVAGAVMPLRGIDHVLVARGTIRGKVERYETHDGPALSVPGEPDHFTRRLVDWLKAEARADLDARCAVHARTLEVRISGLTIRDQSGRWGSCSSARSLSFNWRLVLAPPHVLDYVAAHEVAHILEMNHSQAFWDTVARALPDYRQGKAWLTRHGAGLMVVGR